MQESRNAQNNAWWKNEEEDQANVGCRTRKMILQGCESGTGEKRPRIDVHGGGVSFWTVAPEDVVWITIHWNIILQ